MKPIPYGRQTITQEDIKAVVDTLQSDYLTQGPKVKEFEDAFAQYIGCKHAVAVANGTAALHLAVLALSNGSHGKVITTPITFAASANAVLYCGGNVVFSDIDPSTYLLDITKVEGLLSQAEKGEFQGIIPVDLAGSPINLESFRRLADKHGLWIIEDACHAPGGYFVDSKGVKQFCGNGVYADASIFSFHPVKHIATGEGGMITTNNDDLYKKLDALRSHGIVRNADMFVNDVEFAAATTSAKDYPGWYMEMQMLGFNYRLTDIQSALGISQLSRANAGLLRRKEIAKRYTEAFKTTQQIISSSGDQIGHAYHLYIIHVHDRLGLYKYLRDNSIFCQIHYIPTHLMPYYRDLGWKEGDCRMAEEYYKTCLSLPMYTALTDDEVEYIITKISEFFNGQ